MLLSYIDENIIVIGSGIDEKIQCVNRVARLLSRKYRTLAVSLAQNIEIL